MKYTCVTSMLPGHYATIGGVMIEGWTAYWPQNAELVVYAEGFQQQSNDPRVKFVNWDELCSNEWQNFAHRTNNSNTQRFGKKGFTFIHAMENFAHGQKLLWLDADLLFKQQIHEELLDGILPDDKLIALFDCFYQEAGNYTQEQYEDLTTRKTFGAESGFVLIDTAHKLFNQYKDNYRWLFTNDKHESLVNWYDGEIVISAAREFLYAVEDLSNHKQTHKTQTPLNHCYLAEYMGHIKAKSKKSMTVDQFREISNLRR